MIQFQTRQLYNAATCITLPAAITAFRHSEFSWPTFGSVGQLIKYLKLAVKIVFHCYIATCSHVNHVRRCFDLNLDLLPISSTSKDSTSVKMKG